MKNILKRKSSHNYTILWSQIHNTVQVSDFLNFLLLWRKVILSELSIFKSNLFDCEDRPYISLNLQLPHKQTGFVELLEVWLVLHKLWGFFCLWLESCLFVLSEIDKSKFVSQTLIFQSLEDREVQKSDTDANTGKKFGTVSLSSWSWTILTSWKMEIIYKEKPEGQTCNSHIAWGYL